MQRASEATTPHILRCNESVIYIVDGVDDADRLPGRSGHKPCSPCICKNSPPTSWSDVPLASAVVCMLSSEIVYWLSHLIHPVHSYSTEPDNNGVNMWFAFYVCFFIFYYYMCFWCLTFASTRNMLIYRVLCTLMLPPSVTTVLCLGQTDFSQSGNLQARNEHVQRAYASVYDLESS